MHGVGHTDRVIVHAVELGHQHRPRVLDVVGLGAAGGPHAPRRHLGHHGEAGAEAGLAGAGTTVSVAVLTTLMTPGDPGRGQMTSRGIVTQQTAIL